METIETFIALSRFGLGAAPGEALTVQPDPKAWLKRQTRQIAVPQPGGDRHKSSAAMITDFYQSREQGVEALTTATRSAYRQQFVPSVLSRARHAIGTGQPFAERMVLFWSNHFTVSTAKRVVGPLIPAYEREAIRPFVFGRFSDMLRAAAQHPAMLTYLDNQFSMGNSSPAGRFRIRRSGMETTLNENLARELLELHTLGVNGGYTQNDVVELAGAISGWTHGGIRVGRDRRPVAGTFEFNELFHEPGARTIMGKTYRQSGLSQGEAILDDLAMHPQTARFLSTKLVRHLVSDDPAPQDVAKIARVFLDTGGDLGAVSRALVDLDSAWEDPLPKVKTPYELVISTHRAAGRKDPDYDSLVGPLGELGQVPFSAVSPAGWGDRSADWLSPEALMRRVEWLRKFAATMSTSLHPDELLEETIGPVASDATRLWVSRAPSPDAALAMVLASSEFQRR